MDAAKSRLGWVLSRTVMVGGLLGRGGWLEDVNWSL
jgi:hypothetical protein